MIRDAPLFLVAAPLLPDPIALAAPLGLGVPRLCGRDDPRPRRGRALLRAVAVAVIARRTQVQESLAIGAAEGGNGGHGRRSPAKNWTAAVACAIRASSIARAKVRSVLRARSLPLRALSFGGAGAVLPRLDGEREFCSDHERRRRGGKNARIEAGDDTQLG